MTASITRQKDANGVLRLIGKRGGCAVRFAGTILEMSSWGHGEAAMAREFVAELDQLIAAQKGLVAFNDLERLETYDPAFRSTFDDWGARSKEHVGTVHILVRSKLVAMAIAVFALFQAGRVRSYSKRDEWEKVLREHGGAPLETSAS